jgi:His/Glu/Gln/Arg/opine family amino acid ABC transporter permease subunit
MAYEFDFSLINPANLKVLGEGMAVSLEITLTAAIVGIVWGSILAMMRLSSIRSLSWFSEGYVTVCRSIPLVMVLLWFFLIVPFQALKDCTTSVAKGEVVVVCGPSGSGKSTLIKCVNALEPFQGGEIILDGIKVNDPKTDLPKLRARVGMVFQHFELFPHLRIIENLCLAQEKVLGGRMTRRWRRAQSCSTASA